MAGGSLADRDGWIWPAELGAFSKCFLTGAAAEATPVGAIGAIAHTPGAVTEALVEAYAEAVRPMRAAA